MIRYLQIGIAWGIVFHLSISAHAHHGGIGVEGDLVEWALNVDQWQEEQIDQGVRIKFLAYPRQPIVGGVTRLVFEIQSVETGLYMSGLSAQLKIRAPDGTERQVQLPETTGVTAYYEARVMLEQTGPYAFTFISTPADTEVMGTFIKQASLSRLFGDWYTTVGNLSVLGAFAMTWIGLVLSIQRRFMSTLP